MHGHLARLPRQLGLGEEGDGVLCRLLEDRLDLQVDIDLVADEKATALQRTVPLEAEVLPVQGGPRAHARPSVAEWIDAIAGGAGMERHWPVDAAHREHADDGIVVLSRLADRSTVKDDLRIPLDIEEIDASKVIVADLDPGVDRGRVEAGNNHRLQWIQVIGLDGAAGHNHMAPDLGEHVADRELRLAVRRVDGPFHAIVLLEKRWMKFVGKNL